VVCSCSGGAFASSILPGEEVYKAWANTVNASGGINGHQLQLVVDDDSANPGTSVVDVHKLVSSDHVDVIADQSLVDQAWASFAQSSNVPVIGLENFNPDFYPVAQTLDSLVYSEVVTAKAAGVTNLGLLYCAEAAVCSLAIPVIKAAGQKLGAPLIYSAEISSTAPNYTAQCVAAKQAHVSGISIGSSSYVFERVAANCAQQGYRPIYISSGQGFSMLLTTAPGVKDNLWESYPALPFWANTPAVQAMNSAVDKYYPGLRNNANVWSEVSALSWPSGLLLEDAVKAGGLGTSDAPTAAEITKGLTSLKGDTLDGWSPPLTYVAGQTHTNDCWYTAHLLNGTLNLTNGGKLSCLNSSSSS
jgi:branched-chain amino acid transport system substrate-binding protein